MPQTKKFYRNLLLIVFGAFLLRILCAIPAFCESNTQLRRIDSFSYILPAKALLKDHHFWTEPGSGRHMTKRPPGMPLLLAFCGVQNSLLPAALAGCLLSAFTSFPIGLCGELLHCRKAGYIGAVLHALNLSSIAIAPLILADAPLGFCCAWACFFVLRMIRKRTLKDFISASLFLVAGSWFKPVCVPVLLGGMPFLALIFFGFKKKTLAAWGCVLLLALIFFFPLMLANYRAGAEFDLDSNRGEMYFHSGSAILGCVTGENTGLIRERLMLEQEAFFTAHRAEYPTLRSRNAYNHKKYMELIRRYPQAFLKTHLPQWKMLLPDLPTFLENNNLTQTGRGTLDIMRQKGIFAALHHYLDGRYHLIFLPFPFIAAAGFMYLGALGMLLLWIWKKRWKMICLFMIFAFFYLFAGGPVTMPRYQLPALSLLCIMAGMYFSILCKKSYHHRSHCTCSL